MAVLKHPNIAWNNGTAPNSVAELISTTNGSILPFPVATGPVTLPHPDLNASGGGGGAAPRGFPLSF